MIHPHIHPSLTCFNLRGHSHPRRDGDILIFDPDAEMLRSEFDLVKGAVFLIQIVCYTYYPSMAG